ncbi:MAG: ATP-binding protein [Kiritimatiellae bacterium]|nr:ATP-binding protein [Kiritimatiellia bacterium]
MKPITTSVYTFSNLVEGGFVYVDKTAILRELIRPAFAQYFCARPRRFGKSLAISTFQCIFEGRRELFKGLAIDSSDYEWTTYPVLRLDMGSCQADTVELFWDKLKTRLEAEAARNGVDYPVGKNVSDAFSILIERFAAKSATKKMVLLLDEYDKPLLGHLGTPEVTKFKNALKEFYSVVKTQECFQRFAFMTGVSKFSKVSIFSDLNNLTDITMDARYATLFGYTREEVRANFPEHLAALAAANDLTADAAFAKLEYMYDGFKFEEGAERVFNPVSVGKCLVSKKFKNYWFETGTPTFLVDLFKRNPPEEGRAWEVDGDQLGMSFEPEHVWMLPLMYYTGYLTIKSAELQGDTTVYSLDYPNREVSDSMNKFLVLGLSELPDDQFSPLFSKIVKALQAGEVDEVMEGLKCFFENIPYDLHVKYERYYQSLFVAIFLMLKARVSSEVTTARGRIDAVVETAKFVYVFEFKIRGTSEEALAQIDEKGYAARFAADPRKLLKIGCAFDWDARNLGKWLVG